MFLTKYFFKIKNRYFPERKFRRPRIWSNKELKKISHFFTGSIINVSGWKDYDKQGENYRDYFSSKCSYAISNYSGDHGFQGVSGEIYIDQEEDLKPEYIEKFDVVFNHTTLEHIYNIKKAFQNLCLLSKDIVIIVVPFLQELHYGENYKDYWRFSPYAIKKLFEENGLKLIYLNANNKKNESVYIFAVGSKKFENWTGKINYINEDCFLRLGNKIIT